MILISGLLVDYTPLFPLMSSEFSSLSLAGLDSSMVFQLDHLSSLTNASCCTSYSPHTPSKVKATAIFNLVSAHPFNQSTIDRSYLGRTTLFHPAALPAMPRSSRYHLYQKYHRSTSHSYSTPPRNHLLIHIPNPSLHHHHCVLIALLQIPHVWPSKTITNPSMHPISTIHIPHGHEPSDL